MSFDDFMNALNSMEADGYDVTRGMTRTIDAGDDLGTAYGNTPDGKWSFDEDKQALFDELDFGIREGDLDPNIDGDHDVMEALGIEEEGTEEGEEVEGEESLYEIEDWDGDFKLPDGTVVNATAMKEFANFAPEKEAFEEVKKTYHEREKLVVENAAIGTAAIDMMEQQLASVARNRPLNTYEKAQMEVLAVMRNQFTDFTTAIQNSYQKDVAARQEAQSSLVDANVTKCFETYPDLHKEVPVIEKYIASKGIDDPKAFLRDVNFDPRIIGMLMDATTALRVESKTHTTKAPVKAVRGIKSQSKDKPKFKLPHGVSSRDAASFEAFAALGF